MNVHSRDKGWNDFSVEEKLEGLRNDILMLFEIVEGQSHRNHVVVDAFRLVHKRLDDLNTSQHPASRRHTELLD
jgi:hypothetical protein